jgi:DNA-binding protein H-NS
MTADRAQSLETRVAVLEERLQHQRDIAEAHRKADAAALALAQSQNERHFEALNHEAERINASQAVSVSREKFDAFADSINKQWNALDKRMGAWATGAAVAGYFLSRIFGAL